MSNLTGSRRGDFRVGKNVPARKTVLSRIMALEPRFMFDAAGAVTGDGGAHTDVALPDVDHGAPAADPAFLDALAQSVPVAAGRPDLASAAAASASASDGSGGRTVMFVDPTIADYQTLVDGALPGVEVVVLDPSRDGLVQMADYLNGRSGIDSIQIMAHGSAGRFALGAIDVNADTLAAHGAELAAIGQALTQDGDILIYACNTGAGIDGQAFIIDLAMATGADVAASSDNTGAAALGGNWALETRAGGIEATVALTAEARDSYDALMTATFTLQAGSANAVSALGTFAARIFIAADFDGDGDNDFIFRNNSASPTGVTFWRNNDGVFTSASGAVSGNPFSAITWSGPNSAVLAANFSPFSMLATDVDGDGDIDVVNMASGNARGIWQNNSGVFSYATGSPTLPRVTANTQSVAGDFDGDGDIDVIVRNNTGAPTGVDFWRNDGGTFTSVSSAATNNPFVAITFAALAASFDARFMAAGDVDGDGDIDVINMTSANGRGIWLNNDGVFSIVSAGCLPVGTTAGQFVAGDFDGDGDTDIAFRNASGTGIDFYRASGGTFTLDTSGSPFSAIAFSGGGTNNNFNADLMAALDLDGDGDLDIVNLANSAGRGTFLNELSPPQLTSVTVGGVTVSNVDNPTGVGPAPTITLTFDKTIQSAGAGKIYIREYGTGNLVGTAVTATDTGKVSGVGSGSTITIDPGVTLSSNTRYYIQIDKGAFFDSDGATLGRVDVLNNSTMGLTAKNLFDFTTISNTAPTLDLNGSVNSGTGNNVTLAAAASGLVDAAATVGDTENDSANWSGATLTIARTSTAGTANGAWSSDQFGFTTASGITIDSGDLKSGSTTIGTVTNTGGTLAITFNSSATTALVSDVVKGVTYANSTPAGNATVTVTLTDGSGASTSADVVVTSSDIHVTTTTDTATVDVTNGVSFSEAVAIAAAQSGADTLIMGSGFTGAMALAGNLTLSESVTVNADAANGWILQDATKTITLNTGTTLTFTNSSGTVTVNPMLAGAGGLIKSGAGTLTLSGTNSYTGTTAIDGGTLVVTDTLNGSSAGAVSVNSGGTLAGTGTVNGGVSVASGGTLSPGVVGTNSGVGTLTIASGGLTIASGGTLAADVTGVSTHDVVDVTGAVSLAGTLSLSGSHAPAKTAGGESFVLITNDGSDAISGTFSGLAGGGTTSFNSVDLTASYATGTNSNDFQLLGPVNQAPVLAGTFTTAGTVDDDATTTPFSAVTFTDADDSTGTFTIAITYTAANGALASGGGGLTGTAGNYTLTASSPSALQTLLQALVFTPTANQVTPGATVATTFTLTPNDATTAGTANATTVVTATSINDTPATPTLTGTSVSIFDAAGVTVGTLASTDADTGQTLTYTLVSGNGDTDNVKFSISGTTLSVVDPGTLTAGNHSIRVRVSDGTADSEAVYTITADGTLTVTINNDDAWNGTDTVAQAQASNGGLSLREALHFATSGATIKFDQTNWTGSGFAATTITLGSDVTVAAGVTLDGNIGGTADTVTIAGSGGAKINMGGALTFSGGTGDTLTVSTVLAGATSSLEKTGAGTLLLTGSNSFTGATTVSAGTMLVTGALTGGGTVSVVSGATLGGTGSITTSGTGVTIADGAILAPGVAGTNNGIGKLTIDGNLRLSGGLAVEAGGNGGVGGTDFDQVVVNGTVSLNGGSISFGRTNSYVATNGTVYRVIDNDSTDAISGSPGTFGSIAEGATTASNSDYYSVSYSAGTGNDVTLTSAANPTVSSVSATNANGTYKAGDSIDITVTFNRSVTVTGTPTLSLGTGQTASYSSGSGTNTLTFTYTVQAGDTTADLDYASTTALSGTIADTAGNAATLSLAAPGASGSLGANKAIIIDTGAPTTPPTPVLSAGSDNGSSNSDGITNDTTPTLTGTAEADSTVTLYDTDGTTLIGTGTADGSGNYSITVSALSAGVHSISAKATDAGGNVSSASTGLSVTIDTGAPTVSSVSSTTANGTYKAGDSIAITVALSEAVLVTGTPTLSLGTGRTASYASGSGTSTLTFTYTVQAGDSAADLDYASTTALSGTIADTAGNAATLTLATPGASGSLGANKAIVVDTSAPTVSSVSSTTADGSYKAGDSVAITVAFSEAVVVTGTPTLSLGTGQTASYVSGSGTSTLTFTYTVQAGDSAADLDYASTTALSGTIADNAGNAATLTLAAPGASGSLGANKAIIIDTGAPTVSSVSSSTADGTYKAGDSVTITVAFSEAVLVTGTPTLSLGTGQTASYASGSGTSTLTFTYTVQVGDTTVDLDYASTTALSGTIADNAGNAATLTLAAPGASGSLGANKAIILDTSAPATPPTPVLSAGSDNGSSNSDGITNDTTPTLTGTAEADSTVTLYDTDGTTLIGTGTVDGSGNYSITVSALSAGVHSISAKATDAGGNVSSASTGLSVTIDTGEPTVSSVSSTNADGTYGVGDSIAITVALSEAVTVTGTPTLSLGTGRTASYASGSGTSTLTFTYTVQAGDSAADLDYASTTALSGTIADTAGNAATLTLATPGASGSLGANKAIIIDTGVPLTPSPPVLSAGSDSGSSNSDGITSITTPTLTGSAEADSTVTLYDTDGTTVIGTGMADGSGNYSITLSSALSAGVHSITAKATDAVGNVSSASTALSVTIDTSAPTVLSVSSTNADGIYKAGDSIAITVALSEAVVVTGTPTLSLGTGRTASYSGGSGTSTLTFIYTVQVGDTTADLDYASTTALSGTIADTAGNAATLTLATPGASGSLGANKAIIIDTGVPFKPLPPVLSAGSDNGSSNSDGITSITTPTLTGAAEAGSTVTLYDTDGTTLIGTGTADGSGNYSITVSALSAGAHSISAKATDAVGNVSPASTGLSVTIDTGAPTVSSVSSTNADGIYKAGDSIAITVALSEAVVVTGTPTLSLGTGRTASYSGGSGTSTLTFIYTVQAGDTTADLDYVSTTALSGMIADIAGNAATLTLATPGTGGSLGANKAIIIDTGVPLTPSAPVLSAGSDSGSSSSDGITSITTPTLTGTAEGNSTVTLYDTDGTTLIGTGRADGSGRYSITVSALSAGAHSITAKAIDARGNVSPASTALSVTIDTVAPTVSSVASTNADGSYGVGDSIAISVDFSEAVMVTGTPTLSLGTGRTAGYAGGSGTSTLTFLYTVQAGDSAADLDYASTTALSGTIADIAGNAAALTLAMPGAGGSLGASNDIVIDTTGPVVTSVSVPPDAIYRAGQTMDFTVSFSKMVSVDGLPVLPITLDNGEVVQASYVSGSGSTALTFRYMVGTGQLDTNGIAPAAALSGGTIKDVVGNNAARTLNGVAGTGGVRIDSVLPTVSSVTAVTADGRYTAGDTITLQVLFSEAVTVSDTPTLTLNTGQTARYSGGSGTSTLTFTYDVQPGDNSADLDASGSSALSGSINDAAGNGAVLTLPTPGAANSLGGDSDIVIDTMPPAVQSVVVPADGLYGVGETLSLLVQVSEAVTVSGGTPSILLDIGGVSRQAIFSTAGSTGSVLRFDYVVQAGDSDLDGITIGALSLNGATIVDASRLALTMLANVPDTQGVRIGTLIDIVAPPAPAALALATGSDSGSSGGDRVTNVNRPTIVGTGEPGATVTILIDGVRGGTTTAGSDGAWRATLSGALADGVRTITTMATDAAGNTSPASAALVLTVDTTAPVLTVPGLGLGSDSGASATDRITNVTRPTLTGVAEAGGTVGIVLDGNIIGTTIAGSDGAWSFTVGTALAEGDHSVQATSTDLAGNIGRSASQTFTIRSASPGTPPAPGLSPASDSGAAVADGLTNVARPTLTGTAIPDGTVTILVDGTAIGTVQTDASGAWSLTPASALSGGAHQVQIRVTDVAGNNSLLSNALALTVDATAPTIGAGAAPSSLGAGSTVVIGAGMTLSDTSALDRLAVTLTNAQSGDELVTGTLPGGITVTRDGSRVVLSGVASAADYQVALRAIGLRSSAADPAFGGTVSSRSITVSARDAAGNESTVATVTVPVSNAVTVPPPTTTPTTGAGNGPSSNTSSSGASNGPSVGSSTSAAGSGSSGMPSLSSDGAVDTGRSVTLSSIGGDTAGNDVGRTVTLSNIGGSTASSDAGRSVTLNSLGGQGADGSSSSSIGLSGGTGSTGSSGGISVDSTLRWDLDTAGAMSSRAPSDTGPVRNQTDPEAGAGQGGNPPPDQNQPQIQPDDAPADNPGDDQGGTDGNAPQQGRGSNDRAAAVPAGPSAPGFAHQVARAHGGPTDVFALLAALANHVLPGA